MPGAPVFPTPSLAVPPQMMPAIMMTVAMLMGVALGVVLMLFMIGGPRMYKFVKYILLAKRPGKMLILEAGNDRKLRARVADFLGTVAKVGHRCYYIDPRKVYYFLGAPAALVIPRLGVAISLAEAGLALSLKEHNIPDGKTLVEYLKELDERGQTAEIEAEPEKLKEYPAVSVDLHDVAQYFQYAVSPADIQAQVDDMVNFERLTITKKLMREYFPIFAWATVILVILLAFAIAGKIMGLW